MLPHTSTNTLSDACGAGAPPSCCRSEAGLRAHAPAQRTLPASALTPDALDRRSRQRHAAWAHKYCHCVHKQAQRVLDVILVACVRLLNNDLRIEEHVAEEDKQAAIQLRLEQHVATAKRPRAQAHHSENGDSLQRRQGVRGWLRVSTLGKQSLHCTSLQLARQVLAYSASY